MKANESRVLMQRAMMDAMGQQALRSNEELDRSWVDAIETDPEAVDDTLYEMNAARMEARVKSKAGF